MAAVFASWSARRAQQNDDATVTQISFAHCHADAAPGRIPPETCQVHEHLRPRPCKDPALGRPPLHHQSRINQSLHCQCVSFLAAYVLGVHQPAWPRCWPGGVSMTTRQAGHFFFEPRGFDHVNNVTDEYKEEIKVGYNIQRKIVLMARVGGPARGAVITPSLFGTIQPPTCAAMSRTSAWRGSVWAVGLLLRVVQLWLTRSLMEGVAWATKIITDPSMTLCFYRKSADLLI